MEINWKKENIYEEGTRKEESLRQDKYYYGGWKIIMREEIVSEGKYSEREA